MSRSRPVIALLGQPNAGKSTLFNGLTGSHQHVGNWPGKTVAQKQGDFIQNGVRYTVVDLPGAYSLLATSEEERITRDYIASQKADLVCILVDASQLERSFYMLADCIGLQTPVLLILNMMDVAGRQGKQIDIAMLKKRLSIPVLPFHASDKKQYNALHCAIEDAIHNPHVLPDKSLFLYYQQIKNEIYTKIFRLLPPGIHSAFSNAWLAAKAIEKDADCLHLLKKRMTLLQYQQLQSILNGVSNGILLTGECKFEWISDMLQGCVRRQKQNTPKTSGFDRIATSAHCGILLSLLVILAGLFFSMQLAKPFTFLGNTLHAFFSPLLQKLPLPQILITLLDGAALNALALTVSMTGFVFGITCTFGLIEEVGYMARIAYCFDRLMSRLHLQGKAVMPLLVSFGCTVGGAAGTRVLDTQKERTLTALLCWAVPCGATFAVVPTLAAAFFGNHAIWVLLAIFLTMFLHICITAKLFSKRLAPAYAHSGLVMELPPYHIPHWRSLFVTVFIRVRCVFLRALKVIFIASLVFMLLTYSKDGIIQNSLLYRIGSWIDPITRKFGMPFETFIAFLSSMMSKETVLGVLNALYSAPNTGLYTLLTTSVSKAQALAFLFAVTFNVPCIMAVSATYHEIRSLHWIIRFVLYYFLSALLLSFLTYHIGLFFL